MKKIIVFIIIGTMLSIILSGCGSKNENIKDDAAVIAAPAEANEKIKDDAAAIAAPAETSDDSYSFSKEVPEEFPQHILPLLEDAEILQAATLKDKGGTIIYTVKKPLKDVYEFYRPKLETLEKFYEKESNGAYYFYADTEEFRILVSVTPTGENIVQVMLDAKVQK